MSNLPILVNKILNTAPYQLPPVVHTGGAYTLDVTYRGRQFYHIGASLYDCLSRYYDFAIRVNDAKRFGRNDFNKIPVPAGSKIGTRYPTDPPVTVIK